jgi:hypothetical protein
MDTHQLLMRTFIKTVFAQQIIVSKILHELNGHDLSKEEKISLLKLCIETLEKK